MSLMLAAIAAAVFVAAPPPARTAPCERAMASFANEADANASVRRLDRMPPARQILGVVHEEGGCVRPIVVRRQVGQRGPDVSRPD